MKKKPDFIPNMFDMSHVPPADPANFWWIELNESRVVMADDSNGKIEPVLTITPRVVDGQKVALQITAHPKLRSFFKQ